MYILSIWIVRHSFHKSGTGRKLNAGFCSGWDILLGVSCVAVLLILKELPSLRQKMSGPKLYYCKSLVQLLRLLSIGRYALPLPVMCTHRFPLVCVIPMVVQWCL